MLLHRAMESRCREALCESSFRRVFRSLRSDRYQSTSVRFYRAGGFTFLVGFWHPFGPRREGLSLRAALFLLAPSMSRGYNR